MYDDVVLVDQTLVDDLPHGVAFRDGELRLRLKRPRWAAEFIAVNTVIRVTRAR
ncbi:hypothetical protein [Streptomyces sp. ADI98-10]|uniref:hypothetical protein n=1 Tax=Streptomyces sp. ADI98-10 TaxID=1522763 RepID=UPI0013DE181A|nr:hypothetical protein [Streptomyces sp. ADI98-10]